MVRKILFSSFLLFSNFFNIHLFSQSALEHTDLKINDLGYFELPGLNVMVFDDFYPEGHQGGISIVQFGTRIASNGDVRLEPPPGQWSPVPIMGNRTVDKEKNIIKVDLWYPDSSKDETGFNPIDYPELNFKYTIKTEAVEQSIKITIDMDKPLPKEWADKVGFNLELFPVQFFGEYYLMDGKPGLFPLQANSEVTYDDNKQLIPAPIAQGKNFIVAPGNEMKEIKFTSSKNDIFLYDGRSLYNNGWFVLRSTIPTGAIKNVVEWIITPKVNTEWRYKPVIQVSQVGYHPKQKKFAVIELDKLTKKYSCVQLIKINEDSESIIKEDINPQLWGNFLRFRYLRFDFSDVTEDGLYKIKYGDIESNQFLIKDDVYAKDVWQPTLEYFLPVQMCHMRINDRYKVWHGICHMDDALMAPINHNHFDGYEQGESTLSKYQPGDHVPGLNIGGWHDAGDYDLRIESQAETVYELSLIYELFKIDTDQTAIDQKTRTVEIHQPDGKPDILQQVEHGVLAIVGGYESMGRFYRGIIESSIDQYVHLGDAATMTDNLIYKKNETDPVLNIPLPNDDRWVFTEVNPRRELYAAQTLAAVYRTLIDFNPELANKCLRIAEQVYNANPTAEVRTKIGTAAELFLSTSKDEYKNFLMENIDTICNGIIYYGSFIGGLIKKTNDDEFTDRIKAEVKSVFDKVVEQQKETPYGVPYKPHIWGAGWEIQSFGSRQLFLHMAFPDIFPSDYIFNALNFVLGCHPGENNISFASGVGVNSMVVAYGVNRDEWSYIPGGIGSGTALIRPDLPELKTWPYLWQQTEYVLGGGTTDYLLLVIAADFLLNKK